MKSRATADRKIARQSLLELAKRRRAWGTRVHQSDLDSTLGQATEDLHDRRRRRTTAPGGDQHCLEVGRRDIEAHRRAQNPVRHHPAKMLRVDDKLSRSCGNRCGGDELNGSRADHLTLIGRIP
jgi:hypothetical protein